MSALDRELDRLVDATARSRDRYVDFLRASAICVVVVWHWALSVTHWRDGALIMPNPIADVPLGWLPTWLLQVMPLFFFVGGYANLAAWDSVRRDGGGALAYYRKRFGRLLPPVALFAGVWAAWDAAALVLLPGYRSVLEWGTVVFIPLWFLAAYAMVVLLVPLTAAWHRRRPLAAPATLAVLAVAFDVGRFGLGLEPFGWANTALVWVFVHQLGYLYRDGTLTRGPGWLPWGLAGVGLAGLVALTALPPYPRSMVAVEGAELSHMYPTTVGIAVLALFQTGVALALRPAVSGWLRRRRVWKAIVGVNAVIMTVFLWHMTALVLAIAVLQDVGLPLLDEPTTAWWAQRPLWLLLPGAFLAPLLLLSRFETGPLRP